MSELMSRFWRALMNGAGNRLIFLGGQKRFGGWSMLL